MEEEEEEDIGAPEGAICKPLTNAREGHHRRSPLIVGCWTLLRAENGSLS